MMLTVVTCACTVTTRWIIRIEMTNRTVLLRFSSYQAEIAEKFCNALAEYIGKKLSIPAEFIDDVPWQEKERLLDQGHIQVCWICGLPYIRKNDCVKKNVELLAAPVM